ncbi:GTP diphosphokinase [Litoribrevibacter albus]|uniref:GTP pyrophosphokinase n=1 Tax=Litoribrevibacter albus TaxID=1473156 RepID=A0AA37W644_9GAMM|nr:GTP diphosphokinase [Litoribrevibacter albus]GLQ31195.1 GTP pyrophosphokinase [Litoribrevibacter albus]
MVTVRQDQPLTTDGHLDADQWLQLLSDKVEIQDIAQIRYACHVAEVAQFSSEFGENTWPEGYGCMNVGIEMAEILADLQLDQDTLVAAIVYRAVREERLSIERVRTELGETVANLIEGVLQMAAIGTLVSPTNNIVLGQQQTQMDNIRKMLVAMIDDVRVALIKLAERTCAIRAVKNAGRERKMRVAREVFHVYAPLAHRLGIGHIKWELEDLSFRYLEPLSYKRIAKLLEEKRLDRQKYIENVIELLQQSLERMNIDAEISGRVKHIYSIWRKMQRKKIPFDQVYDIRAVRILVKEVRDCYAILGVVHSLWKHIPQEFDDYIASPKPNGYQSLHTAVIGPSGRSVEIQIRTFDMHEDAELGVCAHWLYKGTDTKSKKDAYEEKIMWLRQVLEWQDDMGSLDGLGDELDLGVAQDRVYVFTPNGHVVDLPSGSTPLDFAYKVHTEVGHACRGAKVNGKIVPLNYKVKTGEQIEILTAKEAKPSRDWLNSDLGYLNSGRARAKVQHWFKEQAREQNIIDGRELLIPELKKVSLQKIDLEKLASLLTIPSEEELFARIGAGDLRLGQVIHAAQSFLKPVKPEEKAVELSQPKPRGNEDIQVLGVGSLMSTLASCCKPVPGDPIVGYITRGKGVSIHRQDCPNVLYLQKTDDERMISVDWGHEPTDTYPVDIKITAYDRPGLLRDITLILANEGINLTAMHTQSDKSESIATMIITAEISDLSDLSRVITKIDQLPNIIDAHRHSD